MTSGMSDFQLNEVITRAIGLDGLKNKEKRYAVECQVELTRRLDKARAVQERLIKFDPTV